MDVLALNLRTQTLLGLQALQPVTVALIVERERLADGSVTQGLLTLQVVARHLVAGQVALVGQLAIRLVLVAVEISARDGLGEREAGGVRAAAKHLFGHGSLVSIEGHYTRVRRLFWQDQRSCANRQCRLESARRFHRSRGSRMFNLIVSGGGWAEDGRDSFPAERALEYTDRQLIERFEPNRQLDLPALMALPTLFVQEGVDDEEARVGTITRARRNGRELLLEYSYDMQLPPVLNRTLVGLARDLDIENFEFTRTHWAVKNEDLFRVLLRTAQPRRQRPRVFQIAEHENIERVLVSAMMPFSAEFNRVYQTLRELAGQLELRCRRADDIWENPAVIQDVVSLIDRSRIVIADCTGRNANVFYEIGIAHTLGREVILITQSEADIPFDLRHLRYVRYLNNGEGLAELAECLRPRLADLV